MRIAFFTHYFPPEGNAPASRTYEHCVRWVSAGHNVTVITGVPNVPNGVANDGYKNRVWPQTEYVNGIKVIRVWTYLAPNAGSVKRILNYVSFMLSAILGFLFFCRRPNIIVATSPQFFCGWAGLISSYLKWTRFVLEIRDIWPESIVTVGAMKKGRMVSVLEILERRMYLGANHIVAVGQGYKNNILSKVNIPDRISVVTNGVDPSQFTPQGADTEFLDRHGLRGKFVCSYVGTIGMAHGLEITLRAAERLKQIGRDDIIFCNVGDGASRKRLIDSAHKSGLSDLVKFPGRLPKSEMPTVLASSHCLLVHLKGTDLFETVIPSKIFEAMAMQRPIIMGVQGESADIVKASHSGIQITPDSDEQLTAAVTRLCDEQDLYDALCQNGRDFVTDNYSRDKLAHEMLETLIRVAK